MTAPRLATVEVETLFGELKRYVGFSDEDAAALREAAPTVRPHFARLAQIFFDRTRAHESAHAAFADEDQIARLQAALVATMERVFSGPYDDAYFERTAESGQMLAQLELPQRFVIASMSAVRLELERIVLGKEAISGNLANATRTLSAVHRALDLELTGMLEAYRDDTMLRLDLRRMTSHRAPSRSGGEASSSRAAAGDSGVGEASVPSGGTGAGRRSEPTALEQRYAGAIELAHILFVGLDARGSVILFNREAERVTGFLRGEVLGTRFAESIAVDENSARIIDATLRAQPESLARLEQGERKSEKPRRGSRPPHGSTAADAHAVASSKTQTSVDAPPSERFIEGTVRTRSGKHRIVCWQVAPMSAVFEGDDVVLFLVGTDVTDERIAAERHRTQAKLSAVGTLAAGLAHEIRNPLNGAQLHIAFLERSLKKSGGDPDLLEAVNVVGDEIKRLAHLVSEFLDFARPQPLERDLIGARAVAEKVVAMVQPLAQRVGAQLTVDLPPNEFQFTADRAKVEQVLFNLLTNAIEAVQSVGGGTVALRVRQKPRDVMFEVEDDGAGFPSDAPIFDAFFSTKPQGTGLGLSITHRIVTDHGGEVVVDCKPGRTVFRVFIPLGGTLIEER